MLLPVSQEYTDTGVCSGDFEGTLGQCHHINASECGTNVIDITIVNISTTVSSVFF
jgi:hypothetical protein